MKIFKILSLVTLVSFLFYGCPSDTPPTPPATTYYDYLPLANGNYWNYTNTIASTNVTSSDSLYIDGTTTISENSYFQFDANLEATGIYTLYMKNIDIRKEDHDYVANGTFTINLGTEAINIAINDEIILSESGNAGDILSTVSGTQIQTVSNISLTIIYRLKTEIVATNASETIAGTTYNNTIQTKTTLNMKIDATVSGVTVSAMNQQDVVTMHNTFANQKGLILSNTDTGYHLEDFSSYDINLGIPLDYSESTQQVIVNFNVN